MKTKIIKGAVDILLLCYNPGEDRDLVFIGADGKKPYEIFLNGSYHKLPDGNWQFHCRQSEMSEDQASALCEGAAYVPDHYQDYRCEESGYKYAKSAFKSLLEANGVLKENPHGKKPVLHEFEWFGDRSLSVSESMVREGHKRNLSEWQEAEANVFNPLTTLIFIKHEN